MPVTWVLQSGAAEIRRHPADIDNWSACCMDLGLAGKVAIVAASSKGLGRACAVALAREGAHVVMCSRDATAIAAAADLAGREAVAAENGGSAFGLVADVTKADD